MLTLEQFKNKKINEAVTSADRTPQNVTRSDGKVRVRMVPTTKRSDTSEVYARPKGKVTVLRKGDPKIKAIQTVQKRKAKAFKDLARKEMGEDLDQQDVKTVKKVVKGLKGAVKAHAGQVKSLTKDIQDQVKMGKPIKGTISKVGVPAAGPKPGEPGSVVKGVRIGRPIKGKISKKGVPAAAFRAEATNPHDDEGANHIIMQLRKSVSLRGMRPVEFKDGKKVKVSMADAQKFLTKYNKSKPFEKEKMQAMAMKSHDGFKKALSESVINEIVDPMDLRGRPKKKDPYPNSPYGRKHPLHPANAGKKIKDIYAKDRGKKEEIEFDESSGRDNTGGIGVRESVEEDRMAGKYKKGQTIVRGQWPNPDKWAEEYIMPNADKKGVKIYSNGPAFVIEKL